MDAKAIVGQWPEILIKILKSDIELAHSINTRSWSIFSYANRPVFGVSRQTILYFDPDTEKSSFQLSLIHTSEETRQWLRSVGNTFDHDHGAIDVNIPLSNLGELPSDLIPAHHAHIRYHAKHRNNRWKSFREDFYQEFSERLGEPLPLPGYYEDLEELRATESNMPAPERKYDSAKVEPTGYWLNTFNINNETEARDYAKSIDDGKVIHRYADLNVDFSQYPHDRKQFTQEARKLDGVGQKAGHRFWLFTNGVEIGDWIVLQAEYPAIGQIKGEYVHTDDGDSREVEWHWISSETVPSKVFSDAFANRNLWGFTTLEPIEFKRILQALGQESLVDMSHISESVPNQTIGEGFDFGNRVDDISATFFADGLNYSDTQIADFYTALQTKGFVVLSGISGTGKSKIATGFTALLPDATVTEIAGPDPVTAQQALHFKVSETQNWAAVSADQSHLFPRMNQNTRYDVDFVFEGGIYRGAYKTRTLNFGKPTLYLILGKALTERLRRAAGDEPIYAQFRAAPNERSLPQVSISLEKPSQEVNTQEVQEIDISNTLFLSVRPDWRDSTSLLGYYNPLTQTYEWTDFLRFILNAADNYRSEDPIAWFVILDEMNLAHVEYYFADLLSVLESGRVSDPDQPNYGFTQEPLRITYPDDIANDPPPTEVYLPPNLYIIGTVNMDETTHAFSPKVLDRAFTMELTEVDFTGYPAEVDDNAQVILSDADKQRFLEVFSQHRRFPQISKDDIRQYVGENDDIRASLQHLNRALAEHRFHFGYRVFDEIVQFLANAEDNGMYPSRREALDSAAFMKILPKFSGSEARVGKPLEALIAWANDPFGEGDVAIPLVRTLKRSKYMQHVLQSDGFVTAF